MLYQECDYMNDVTQFGIFIAMGAILTTFCASTSNLIGSSRVLQAVAQDQLLGPISKIFIRGTTDSGNPVAAVFISWILVQCVMFVGSLNKIAKLCSVLYLMSYCFVNAACFSLDWASASNFRPGFSTPWWISLLGMLSTFVLIFVVDAGMAAIAIALNSLIFFFYR